MSSSSDRDFEVRRQLVQMQMLYEVGLALSESLDPAHVAEQILHRALAMVDARGGALLTSHADDSSSAAASSDGSPAVFEMGIGEALPFLTQMPSVKDAWKQDSPTQIDRGADETPRHLALVPLRFHDEVAGLLILTDKEERGGSVAAFDDDDQAMLDSFALQAGAALRNARLHRELQSAFDALQAAQEKIAQLEQLRALGDLAADLTHSMRHVLGLVMGHADTYLALKTDPEMAMTSVMSAAEGGQDLIARIDRVTRLGVGSERTLEQLGDVVEEALADAKLIASSPSVSWQTDHGADLPKSYLNRADTKEVIVNLLVNAAQSIEADGTVTITTRSEDGQLRLEVADTGKGIPEQIRERIFDPFFTTKDGSGTGLGLSIVLRIVEDHDGSVHVDSVAGQGSCFTILLPVVESPRAETTQEEIFDDDDTEDSGRR